MGWIFPRIGLRGRSHLLSLSGSTLPFLHQLLPVFFVGPPLLPLRLVLPPDGLAAPETGLPLLEPGFAGCGNSAFGRVMVPEIPIEESAFPLFDVPPMSFAPISAMEVLALAAPAAMAVPVGQSAT